MSRPPTGAPQVPPPPKGLKCNVEVLPAGTVLHRIHETQFGAAQFNPGFGRSRFAPFQVNGVKIPTAYAATSLECAVYEMIFHDIDPAARFKSVLWSRLSLLSYSTLVPTRDLKLAKLFNADLLKWGLERRQLID